MTVPKVILVLLGSLTEIGGPGLCIGVLGMVRRKSRFLNLTPVDGTTQEFVSGTFRSVNSKAA